MDENSLQSSQRLEPLPYHLQIRDFLKREEAEIWEWYRSTKVREDQAELVRFELLKSTYRVDRESQPKWYDAAEEAAEKLGLEVPITIYQAQNPEGLNAGLAFLPNEGHLVLSGPVGEKLSSEELLGVFAHELSHLLLWQGWEGEFLLVDNILAALTNDRQAHPAHLASARLFYLYNEIFCDRGALYVVEDPLVVVSGLVKMVMGLDSVSPQSYLKQAEEIFTRETGPSKNITHPEMFIRARAVKLWSDKDDSAEAKITQMIEGPAELDGLDLLAQQRIAQLTRRMINLLLAPEWMQTDSMLGHARLFFDGYDPPASGHVDESLQADMRTTDKPLIDYYCYVLLDFVTIDRELEEGSLAAALVLAESLELKDRLMEIARKELRLTKRQLEKIDTEKKKLLKTAAKELKRTS